MENTYPGAPDNYSCSYYYSFHYTEHGQSASSLQETKDSRDSKRPGYFRQIQDLKMSGWQAHSLGLQPSKCALLKGMCFMKPGKSFKKKKKTRACLESLEVKLIMFLEQCDCT